MERALTEESSRRIDPRGRGRGRGLLLLEAIGTLIGDSGDLRGTLERIVALVAERLDMEVCSIYRYDAEAKRLHMVVTRGLDPGSVAAVSMGIDEGLTGFAIQKGEPVMAIDALAHPRYKYFPETGEERYHSFLGVPIVDRREALGVLVVQTSRRRRFTRDEVRLMKAVAVPVGGLLTQLRLLESLESKEEERRGYQRRMLDAIKKLQAYERRQVPTGEAETATASRLVGVPAAPGFGIGRAHLLESEVSFASIPRRKPRSARKERERFHAAIAQSVQEIERMKARVQRSFPEIDAALFDVQQMMLTDTTFARRVERHISGGSSAEVALERVVTAMVDEFARLADPYMRERAVDVKDIGQRTLRNLLGVAERDRSFASAVVLIAEELTLSDILLIEPELLKGIVMGAGGATSHASILAKSLEIPTVVGVERLAEIHEGEHLIIDGNAGTIYVNPSGDVLREYGRLRNEYAAFNRELDSLRALPAVTRDGCRIMMGANIGLLGDLPLAHRHGADRIGLYRTEIAFLSHRDFLSEEDQVTLYDRIAEAAQGLPLTVRTLDLGADKYPPYLHIPEERNPFLGWRSIRVSLELASVFKTQLRAILRASPRGPLRIMLPMISSLEELRRSKELIDEAKAELRREGVAFDASIPVGMMVEVPSAVQLADRFIEEVDFFSIGTNDLIQYLLAVDRNNRKVASLYEPLHPAVLRAVASVVRVADAAGKPVSLCGEMAADPVCTLVLIGMGLRDLSMSAFFVPVIKRLIRSVDIAAAERVAAHALTLDTVREVKRCVFEQMRALDVIDLMETYH
ncbi:phosphoenolpyruvate--protein phosphotransferase [bacterium]|nr:phosphoenolpyruvate--protein phosphotransferase [bacterium]